MERFLYEFTIIIYSSLFIISTAKVSDNVVTPPCPPEMSICSFRFLVQYNMTMMSWVTNELGEADVMLPVINGKDGLLYSKRKDCSGQDPLTKEGYETLISGDGHHKRIVSINGKLPGPPIVVYEGQQVSVLVINELADEVITLHWHGLKMYRTPWMDGGGFVSHCPIQPRQTFEYRFLADTAGTFWYHGHVASERTMGLAGHITVLERSKQAENEKRGSDKLPTFEKEFHLMIADWAKRSSEEEFFLAKFSNRAYPYGIDTDECYLPTQYIDGTDTYWAPFYSAIINGKGQRFNPRTNLPENPNIPREIFTVKKGGYYRFRIANSGMDLPFKISIDEHMLHVIASDGNAVTTTTGTHLVVASGETYDVYIKADDSDGSGNYWIRGETLEYMDADDKKLNATGHVEAILRYEDNDDATPKSLPHNCTETNKCIYLNCLDKFYRVEDYIICIPLISLRHPMELPTLLPSDGRGFTEYILSMQLALPGYPATINGIQFLPYSVPPQIYPNISGKVECDDTCNMTGCRCTHELKLPKDHIIQLTLYAHRPLAIGAVSSHPIHLHGHNFQVVKVGWPSYSTSGLLVKNNQDIECGDPTGWCNAPKWADRSWENGKLPAILERSAPVKNTIVVPGGGYVVLRFKADNPGYWLMHCHMELHHRDGMTLVFKEGEVTDMPSVPRGFPTCGNFDWGSQEFYDKINNPQPPVMRSVSAGDGDCFSAEIKTYQVTTVVLGVTLSLLALAMIGISSSALKIYKSSSKKGPLEHTPLLVGK